MLFDSYGYKENNKTEFSVIVLWTSYKGSIKDDLADSGDEGRGKQRYAPGSRKQALIRRFPNGTTSFAS